jgi:hypothetical protein
MGVARTAGDLDALTRLLPAIHRLSATAA